MSRTRDTPQARTSWIDRTWANHWGAIAVSEIRTPALEQIRSTLAEFMAADPNNPLNCVLSDDGRRWIPVQEARRASFLDRAVIATEPMDLTDMHTHIRTYAPPSDERAGYRLAVSPNSLTCYWAHVLGDVVPNGAFPVLLCLGDADGLPYLRPDVGLITAGRLVAGQFRSHWRDWWRYSRKAPAPAPVFPRIPVPDRITSDGVGFRISASEFAHFQHWRRQHHPDLPASALLAAAAYKALARHGVPLNPAGFHTVIDLRRYLPANHALRSGNLAKSIYIPADMTDPSDIAHGIRSAVDSARAAPAMTIGALRAGLLGEKPQHHRSEIEYMTLTFNLMMRNPGIDHLPWRNPAAARYTVMTYPSNPDNLTVAACGVNGALEFAVSFVPELAERSAIHRALAELRDVPALLSAAPPAG